MLSKAWPIARGFGLTLLLVAAAAAQGNNSTFVIGQSSSKTVAVNTPHWTLAPPDQRLPNPTSAQIQTIIQTFTAKERTFMSLLAHNYTYTESILVQQLDANNNPTGSFQQTNNIVYTPSGGRQIACTYCPQPTLTDLNLTEDDLTDMFNMNMYTVSTATLPEYNIAYLDHQKLDDITAYLFRVQPKKIIKGHRYFDGVIYVDDQTLSIVKSIGKVVPDQYDKHGNPTNTFLPFTIWRKEIDGKYWFPVYTLMQGEVPSEDPSIPPVPMRMVIQFTKYKRFGASSRILSVKTLPQDKKKPDTPKKKPGGGGNPN